MVQHQLAAVIEVDTPMYNKIKHGERKAKREHVQLLAKELHIDKKEFLTIWLADKVVSRNGLVRRNTKKAWRKTAVTVSNIRNIQNV